MLGLSFVVGWFLTLSLGERDGLRRDDMVACFYVTAVAAMVGARLLFVVTNPDRFHGPLDFFRASLRGHLRHELFHLGRIGLLAAVRKNAGAELDHDPRGGFERFALHFGRLGGGNAKGKTCVHLHASLLFMPGEHTRPACV